MGNRAVGMEDVRSSQFSQNHKNFTLAQPEMVADEKLQPKQKVWLESIEKKMSEKLFQQGKNDVEEFVANGMEINVWCFLEYNYIFVFKQINGLKNPDKTERGIALFYSKFLINEECELLVIKID